MADEEIDDANIGEMRHGLEALADAAEAVREIRDVDGSLHPTRPRQRRRIGDRATSAWMITMNTNRTPRSDAEAQQFGQAMQQAARNLLLILRDPTERWDFLELVGADAIQDDTDFDVRIVARVEIGPNYRRLHQHMAVIIRHRTRIRLNTAMIVALWNRWLAPFGWDIPFMHIKTFNMPIDRVIDYIEKGTWYGSAVRR